MTSPRQTNTPERGGDEVDAFSRKARRLLKSFNRAGVAKAAKRAFNRRARRAAISLGDLRPRAAHETNHEQE